MTLLELRLGGPTQFFPIFSHPQILISMCPGKKWEKCERNGEKVNGKRGKSIRFSTLLAYYCYRFLHIKQDISCNILHDLVMTVSS